MLASLKPGMRTSEAVLYGDGNYHHIIYGIGPYIADYPEQCLITCIVQWWYSRYIVNSIQQKQTCLSYLSRCLAIAKKCDDKNHHTIAPQTLKHTQLLLNYLELNKLWYNYGLVGKVIV
jgi:hypothetical protein